MRATTTTATSHTRFLRCLYESLSHYSASIYLSRDKALNRVFRQQVEISR